MKEEQTIKETKRTDLFKVDVRNVRAEEEFNIREDYGDIDLLALSIEENGIRVPLRGYRKGEEIFVINGHRRLLACQKLIGKGIFIMMPFYMEERGTHPEQRVFDMFVCNDGKDLNPLEQANGIQRLINYGYSEQDIAAKIGKTLVYVCNLKLLSNAPQNLKNKIREEKVSSSLVIKILRSEKDFDKASDLIEKAFAGNLPLFIEENAVSKSKITEKDIFRVKDKVNSFAELKKAFREAEKEELVFKDEKKEILELLMQIVDGKITKEKFLKLLFEQK